MSIRTSLRWKILLPLLFLSIIPLAAIFTTVTILVDQQFHNDLAMRIKDVSAFLERSAAVVQLEKANYLELMSQNPHLAIAVEDTRTSDDSQVLQQVLEPQAKKFNFDIIEVLDPQGALLYRLTDAEDIPMTTGPDNPAIASSLEGTPYFEPGLFDGKFSMIAAVPIRFHDGIVGHLVGVTFFDSQQAQIMKSGSGAEIAFYDESGVVGASNSDLAKIDVKKVYKGTLTSADFNGVSHTLFTNSLGGAKRGVLMALDQTQMLTSRTRIQNILISVLIISSVLAVLIGSMVSRTIVRPLALVVDNLKEIAEGEGDLTKTLPVTSKDEVGQLAENFNSFIARLAEMVRGTRQVSSDLADASRQIVQSSQDVNAGAARQSNSLEESYRALQGIDESINGIADSTSQLVDAAEESSSATLELGATIEQIASQMENLFSTVEEVSSSISEMSVSSQQIAENVDILSSSTEITASSINQMDAAIKEIEENAEQTSSLSEEAASDAQVGKEAVAATIRGINDIREIVDHAGHTIQDLGNQSNKIGSILTVIDDIADQTSLLALNAAIIAAQAGEHGKGFAVVADEIRELAERTAVSTREIAGIISNLQNGTQQAVKAMTTGSKRVHEEVQRSEMTGEALDKIHLSTSSAMEQVKSIVRATQEQARGSQQITTSINQVASMLTQITSAIKQQSTGTQQLARASEAMKEIASQVKLSTGEQAKGSHQINANIEKIRMMIERIDEATREQSQRSRQVVEAVSSIRGIAENNLSRTSEFDQVIEALKSQTKTLENEVGAFKV